MANNEKAICSTTVRAGHFVRQSDPRANTNGHTYAYCHTNANGHQYTDAHSDTHQHTNAHRDTAADSHAHAHTDSSTTDAHA